MRGLWRIIYGLFVGTFVVTGSFARGETVRTIDDKVVSGTIKGFADGELLLQTQSADAAVVKIPIAEIVEMTLRPPVAKPQPAGKPTTASPSGGSPFANMLGTFLGLSSGPSPDASDSSGSTDQPDAGDEGESPPESSAPATGYPPGSPMSETPVATAAPAIQAAAAPIGYAAAPAVQSTATAQSTTAAKTSKSSTPATAPHAKGPLWRIELGAADHVTAALGAGSENHVKLSLDGVGAAPLEIPVDQLRAIWSSNDALVKKARDLKSSAAGQDVAFVEKNGEVKAVAGVMTGIMGDDLTFKFEGEDRKIKLDRLVGVTLAQRETQPERSIYESFSLVNGDVLSGRLESIEHGVLRMKPLAAGDAAATLEIPLALLAMVEIKNGRLTWLGDLAPSAVSQVPYFDRLMPYRVNQSLTGGQLVLADGPISKGVAVHSKCVLTYDIHGGYEHFRAKVGFQQPDGKAGRAPVRILGDDKVLWHQDDLKGAAAKPAAVDLDVAGVKRLTLEADFGPNQDVAGRVVWGEARLVKAAAK
jgi:NPCBM/NEW2 domain